MGIELKTTCGYCVHQKVCKYKNNAQTEYNKFKTAMYGTGSNNDYDNNTMMEHLHVDVTFACSNYRASCDLF